MLIENIDNTIKLTISSSIDKFGLERVIYYLKYLETTTKSIAKQSDIDKLADDVNAEWYLKNKSRFIR